MVEFRRDWIFQITTVQREMERLLDHFAGAKPPSVRFSPRVWEPAIDVCETHDKVVVVVELAGVEEQDIEITVNRDRFLIRGERKRPSYGERRTYYQMEIPGGPFEREVPLPAVVDPEGGEASYKDGLLEVVLPKLGPRHRKVEIKSG